MIIGWRRNRESTWEGCGDKLTLLKICFMVPYMMLRHWREIPQLFSAERLPEDDE